MLIEQTNDGLANAETYVSVDAFERYMTMRGITVNKDPEQLLILAMDYLEARNYAGEHLNDKQNTLFPKKGVGVPVDIKKAQMALAVIADSSDLMPNTLPDDVMIKREKIDVLETEYERTGGSPSFPFIEALLSPYLIGSGAVGLNFAVNRA